MFVRASYQVLLLLSLCSIAAWTACRDDDPSKADDEGKALAMRYCSSCHLFPEPSLLPQSVWIQKVLPNMAARMGLPMGNPYKNLRPEDIELVVKAHIIPEQPLLSEADMLKIVAYYKTTAPEHPLPQQRDLSPENTLSLFTPKKTSLTPISTKNILLKPIPGPGGSLLLGFEDRGLWRCQPRQNKVQQLTRLPIVDVCWFGASAYLLDIRQTQAYNLPIGGLWETQWANDHTVGEPRYLIDSLARPVSMDVTDLNGDGKPDFAIAEFGDYLGRLSLHLSTPNGRYHCLVLKNTPGACKVFFRDMNADGRMDLVALMSQGREEICIFYNTGSPSVFKEQSIAAFPPSYGSNDLEIADLNQDGHPDLLMTNGDNADISSSLKAYHGVRYLENDGQGNFQQRWFYPMYGASAVVAADFDRDGDIDLAAIAHFPNFRASPPENFLFFQNDGKGRFKPFGLPTPLNGRLLRLAKMDVDGDGDEDLLIGNYINQLTKPDMDTYAQWQKEGRDWWWLENTAIAKPTTGH